MVLQYVGSGIPILFARSCLRWGTTAPDGRRMSINVEVIGGSPMVQHYVEEIAEPHHRRLISNSDVFTPAGRIKVGVIWDLSVKKIDADTGEQPGSQCVHTGAPGHSSQTGHPTRRLPIGSQARFRGAQPAGDTSLRQEH